VHALWRCVPNVGFTSDGTFDNKRPSIDSDGGTEQVMATASGQVPEFPVGSLVRIRERDWVVLPSDDADIVCLRPLSGSESEICGIHRQIEGHALKHAEFAPPKPEQAGDFIAGKLLRNAARLGLRNGAGPFRSLGRLSVRPRPYQFVPLIMALKLDPVRMLIADDVGVGKTIEAAMIARELLERGDAQGICVICPPHLCDQWQKALETKFHIHAKVVRTSTLARLERDLPRRDLSVYRYYKHLVVSIDFVKRDSRRAAFLSDCPDFVIVDEAHTATEPGGVGSREQQQRHQLVHEVAKEQSRHILLLTATPHSGIEGSFRSLLGAQMPMLPVSGRSPPTKISSHCGKTPNPYIPILKEAKAEYAKLQ
jgi:SNF2 family DNA or RNA helicase